jgi:hypothetical protein
MDRIIGVGFCGSYIRDCVDSLRASRHRRFPKFSDSDSDYSGFILLDRRGDQKCLSWFDPHQGEAKNLPGVAQASSSGAMASMPLTRASGLIGATVAALLFVAVVQQVHVRRATLFVRCGAEGCADDVAPGITFSAAPHKRTSEESGLVQPSEPQQQTQFKDRRDPRYLQLDSLCVV